MSVRRLRVLIAHNQYQQLGGEDAVVASELKLLRSMGHEVFEHIKDNASIGHTPPLKLAWHAMWSNAEAAELRDVIRRFKPDVAHFHNTFPLLSPAVLWAAQQENVPVVQTLHNFRLMCPQAMFLRNGKICEDCLGTVAWRGIARACYRQSKAQTAVSVAVVSLHRALGTYESKVARYIALNKFSRAKFIEGGLPADKIAIKPNFADLRDPPQWTDRSGGLFVGRLSPEKGLNVLLDALDGPPRYAGQLEVIGGGEGSQAAGRRLGTSYLGPKSLEGVTDRMSRALFLVVPSICYENFPRTIVEAFSCGTPVIASGIGGLGEIVHEGKTGLLFEVGNSTDLRAKLDWARVNPKAMLEMGKHARTVFEQLYSPAQNYEELLRIYTDAIETSLTTA